MGAGGSGGRRLPASGGSSLALNLLVFDIGTDDADLILAANDATFITDRFDGSADFHGGE